MENCYKILGVPPTASAAEIKRAYRKKVKELHPDTSGSPEDTEAFKILVKAYEILSDVQRRSMFDMSYAGAARYSNSSRGEHTFDYRAWLSARTDPESRAKLIFFDLLHAREDDAVQEFIKISSECTSFHLSDWFTREDFMDFGFILCEELVLRGQYYDAALLLIQIIHMEQTFAYFRHFFPEVQGLAKDIIFHRLEGVVSDELALDIWEQALDLSWDKSCDAQLLIKMAAAYIRMDDFYTARVCYEEAVRLDRRVPVAAALRRRMEQICG